MSCYFQAPGGGETEAEVCANICGKLICSLLNSFSIDSPFKLTSSCSFRDKTFLERDVIDFVLFSNQIPKTKQKMNLFRFRDICQRTKSLSVSESICTWAEVGNRPSGLGIAIVS